MLYLHVHIGDALAFMHVQAAWGRGLTNPLTNIVDGLLLKEQEGHHVGYRLTMAIFALLGLGAAVYLMLRRRVGMGLFVALSLILALMTGMQSILRYTIGLAPVKAYPNPVSTELYITVPEPAMAQLIDATGRSVLQRVLQGNDRIPVSDVPQGTYLVRLLDLEGRLLGTQQVSIVH